MGYYDDRKNFYVTDKDIGIKDLLVPATMYRFIRLSDHKNNKDLYKSKRDVVFTTYKGFVDMGLDINYRINNLKQGKDFIFRLNCSGYEGVVFNNIIWFHEDNPDNNLATAVRMFIDHEKEILEKYEYLVEKSKNTINVLENLEIMSKTDNE